MKPLDDKIKSLFDLDAESKDVFTALFSRQVIRKYDSFARKGEYSKKFAFVESGVLRAYFSNDQGGEYNKTFFTEGSFVGAYSSLVSGEKKPDRYWFPHRLRIVCGRISKYHTTV
jgi:CRP-like cAMP-binding protein